LKEDDITVSFGLKELSLDMKKTGLLVISLILNLILLGLVFFMASSKSAREQPQSSKEREVQVAHNASQADALPKVSPETFKGGDRTIKTSEQKSYFSRGGAKLPFYLINGLGKLTSEAIAQAGLTETEAQEVERIVARVRSSAEDSITRRLTLDSEKSQPDKGQYVFYARASTDRGQGLEDQLKASLEKLLGSSRAAILAASYDIDNTPLGYDGKDLHFEVKYPSNTERKNMMVSYEVYNPETGNRFVSGHSSIEAFERRFGSIIDFPKK